MKLRGEIAQIERALDFEMRKLHHPEQSGYFTGTCFISYETQADKINVLSEWEIGFLGRVFPGLRNCCKGDYNKIMGVTPIVTEPAEPDEILWENLGTPMSTKIQLRILNSFLTLLMLGASFGIILLLKYAQVVYFSNRPGQDANNDFSKTLLSLAITASISFINTLLVPLIRAVTLKEKYSTLTNYNVEVA